MEYDYPSGDERDYTYDSDVEPLISESKNNNSMYINKCCFCNNEIPWESQSCGLCSRGLSSYGLSFGPSVLPDYLHRIAHPEAKENVVRNISYTGANLVSSLLTESEFRETMNNTTCFQTSYNALTDPIEILLKIAGASIIS